jgi:hypothetical protein
MKSFTYFFEEADEANTQEPQRVSDDAVTVFGRHNPPHLGHKLTLDRASDIAGSIGDKAPADQSFYTSRSQDPKKNPLPYEMKVDYLKKMFPDHAKKWDTDENVRTILGAATKAGDKGYKNFHFVGGGDRRQGMEDLLRRYNGNLYDFENIYSHSAGERDESGEGDDPIAKLSASGMRNFAGKDDFEGFKGGLPIGQDFGSNFTEEDARKLFDAVRMFGQKNESMAWEVDYRSHKEFIREIYREGELIAEGDIVESLTSGLVGRVHRCGTNHVICVTENGIMFKNFVHDVQVI